MNSEMAYWMHADLNKRHGESPCFSEYKVTKCPPNAAQVRINCCIYPDLKITLTFTFTLLLQTVWDTSCWITKLLGWHH